MTKDDNDGCVDKLKKNNDAEVNDTQTVAEQPVAGKKQKKKKKNKTPGSAKGIETMFRNAYRTQLDFISLAATKANIMISLNGFIVSVLLVSGGFFYNSVPILLVPIGMFMISSGISIYFALASASPSVSPVHKKLLPCIKELFLGNIGIRDFGQYMKLPERKFDRENANILVFEDSARLNKKQYVEQMDFLINDTDQVYKKMSEQLHWMGQMANKKFVMLRYSYATFRWGLTLSIFLFVGLKAGIVFFPKQSVVPTHVAAKTDVLRFKSIYEPSGVLQLPDGRVVIVEDEPTKPWHVLKLKADGKTTFERTLSHRLRMAFEVPLVDLEAITQGPDGYYYAITSHHRNKKGERQNDREQLLRFRIENNSIVDTGVYPNLMEAFVTADILGEVDEHGKGGLFNLNIEAMSFDKQQRLMLGLRDPQIKGKSIIVILENPVAIFERKETARILGKPVLLDLQGGGIRAMVYDAELGGYLLSNEVFGENNARHSQLMYWDGNHLHQPKRIAIPILNDMRNIEGIAPVIIQDEKYILLVSDNGDLNRKQGADYLLLGYDEMMPDE